MCFLYQYVSKHELDNQGVALHLFRASKYIGKIRLSNSIQTFFFTNMSSVIVMSCLSKYYLLMKNGWTKRVYKSTVACVNRDKELTELLFKFSSDRNKNIYEKTRNIFTFLYNGWCHTVIRIFYMTPNCSYCILVARLCCPRIRSFLYASWWVFS